MNKRNLLLLKILLFLFALNSLSLCLYFTSHSRTLTPSQTDTQARHSLSLNRLPLTDQNRHPYRYSKPWPILPSYLPWSQTTQVPFRSCEAYFGNGFTNRVDLLKPKKDLTLNRMGWFKCWFSETLRSSVCEGGGLRMDPEKIKMSRGGEILEEVIGRGEEEELPEFQTGAFQIDGGDGISGEDQRLVTQEFLDEYVPHGEIVKHTMRELIGSVRIVPTTELQCNELNPVHKKVPVLVHRGKPIAESTVILEYIEETWPDNCRLLPQDAHERASARFWIQFYVYQAPIFGAFFELTAGEEREKTIKAVLETLKILEEQGLGDKKFFGGETISSVDITHGWLPHWFEAIEEMVGVKVLEASTLPRLHAWVQNFKQVPVIKDNLPDYQKLLAHMTRVRKSRVPDQV